MKALFYFRMNLDKPELIGVRKKFEQFLKAFRDAGIETDIVSFSDRGVEFNGEVIKKLSRRKLIRGWQYNAQVHKFLSEQVDFGKYDFAWMRVGLTLPWFYRFVQKAMQKNPRLKIVLEQPTYPFEAELKGFIKKLYPLSEFYLKRLKKYLSHIATFCGQDEIHGIPCIKMSNGIDAGEFECAPAPEFSDTLNLIAVSSLQRWHGYDRLIEGLRDYYENSYKNEKIKVIFHVVGEGDERALLEKMTADAGLEGRVIFHGFKTGEELNEIFAKSHLAIGTLGMHRININVGSTLKVREYCARGKPFVLATEDLSFPSNTNFVKFAPPDESPINVSDLIEFYRHLKKKNPSFTQEIRRFAEENLGWRKIVESVLREIS